MKIPANRANHDLFSLVSRIDYHKLYNINNPHGIITRMIIIASPSEEIIIAPFDAKVPKNALIISW
jgi:hypothetical protein